jgi:hypothetical protein
VRRVHFVIVAEVGDAAAWHRIQIDPAAASLTLPEQGPVTVETLCAAAEVRAQELGHRLGTWEDVSEAGHVARLAACAVCGEIAYARVEGDLHGVAGGAISKRCSGP